MIVNNYLRAYFIEEILYLPSKRVANLKAFHGMGGWRGHFINLQGQSIAMCNYKQYHNCNQNDCTFIGTDF